MDENIDSYAIKNLAQKSATSDPFSLERYAQFAKYLPKKAKEVLDIGCAEGRGGAHLMSLRPDLILSGLDCVEERLDKLPGCYTHKVQGLTNQIPLSDKSMDAVLAGEFLEHLYPADVDPTLCEFQRILRIGGMFLMTTPNPHSLKMRLKRGTVYGTAHLTQHDSKCLKIRLIQHGFSRVRILGSGAASRYFGDRFPYLSVYGSYLVTALKI